MNELLKQLGSGNKNVLQVMYYIHLLLLLQLFRESFFHQNVFLNLNATLNKRVFIKGHAKTISGKNYEKTN